jgi:lauroyl/myristoyl acyltransferase
MIFALLILVNVALLPVYALGFLLAFVLTFLPIFPARVARQNIRERLKLGFAHTHFLTAKTFFHYFLYLIEIVVVWPLGLTQLANEAETRAWVREKIQKYRLRETGRGFVFLAPHFGSIEVVGQGIASMLQQDLGKGVVALAQPSRAPGATFLAAWYRKRRGIETVLTSSKELLRTLAEVGLSGHTIGLLVDQKPRRGGVFIPFFGAPAAFPHRGLGVMVESGVPVLFVAAVRIFPGYFRYVYADASNFHLSKTDQSSMVLHENVCVPMAVNPVTVSLLVEFAQWLEMEIAKNPSQWCWDYRKWSRKMPLSEKNN